jgi:hypothetical protein
VCVARQPKSASPQGGFQPARADQTPVTDAPGAVRKPADEQAEMGNEAAQESNLPSAGLRRPAGFEDRIGHQAGATPAAI